MECSRTRGDHVFDSLLFDKSRRIGDEPVSGGGGGMHTGHWTPWLTHRRRQVTGSQLRLLAKVPSQQSHEHLHAPPVMPLLCHSHHRPEIFSIDTSATCCSITNRTVPLVKVWNWSEQCPCRDAIQLAACARSAVV